MEWEKKFDELSLARGKNIYHSGKVVELQKSETEIRAAVTGIPRYEIFIALRDGAPVRMRCQCPKYRGRGSCEHLAAVLYAAFGAPEPETTEQSQPESTSQSERKSRGKRIADAGASPEEDASSAAEAAFKRKLKEANVRKAVEAERKAREDAERQRKEEAEKKAQEAAERERRRQEVQQRIAQREAEKREKKVERRRKRQEAEEQQRRVNQETERLRQEEETRRREETARLQQEEAERKAKAEEARRAAEQEAERRRQERIQAAIERKKQMEAKEDMRTANASEAARPSEVTKASAQDSYRYFDFVKLRKQLRLSMSSVREGKRYLMDDALYNMKLTSGYTDSRQDMVIEATATGKEKKREFTVKLVFSRDEILYVTCGCPDCVSHYRYWYTEYRDCGWVSALLDAAEGYIQEHGIGDATDRTAMWVLRSFNQEKANQVMAQVESKEESLSLVPRLQEQGNTLRLSFRVGTGKLFVVKNLFDFCSYVRNSQTATYGSNTQINHRLENFTRESREWYDFINKVIQEEERLEERLAEELRFSYRGSRLNALELYGWRLDQFYELLGERSIEYERKDYARKIKERLTCLDAQPEISMRIKKSQIGNKKEFHGVSVFCQMPEFFYGVDNAYFIKDSNLCRASKELLGPVQTLAQAARDGSLTLQVGRRQLSEFYYSFLPALRDSVKIEEENPEEIRAWLPPEVSFVFYLDAEDENLWCRAHAVYGEREVTVLDLLERADGATVVVEPFRMKSREEEVLYQVLRLFPFADPEQDSFHCAEDETLMYQVLEHGVDDLAQLGEVRCTRSFRDTNVIRHMKVSVGVSVSKGLLDLEIGTEDVSREELLDILKSYRAKKKYFRLKNGDFLNLEDNSLELLNELMESLRLTPKEFVKGKMHLPAYRALYMDRLLEENENVYNTRDSRFKELVKNFKTINDADFEEPASLTHILRGYQKNGFKWLKTLETYGFGGILADDMGLGKTLQMIAVLLDAKESGREGTSLIVSPASLVYNWEEEIRRFAPQLCTLAVTGTQEARHEKLTHSEEYDVLITSYDLLKRDVDQYEDKHFLYEVIDEAQYIKNHTTAAAKAVKVIRSTHKFALTGTPIENRLSELWSIFDYLMPGFLYGYDVFKREMEGPIVKSQDENALKRLQKMTGPFILRRLKTDVLKDLPEKLEEVRYVQMESTQRKAYDAQVVHMQEMIGMQSSDDFSQNKMQVLAELTRLRQICCDPSLCFENYRGESAKLEACLELITSAIDGGHKMLLFSQFTTMLEILQKRLEEMNIPFYTITGATGKEKRLQLVKAFNADDTPLFLISLKAGGVGLNLTGADVVIHYDPWWNLAAQDQATDRAHRIGQTRKVTVYKLIARQTVEEKILALQENKRNLADSIVSAQEGQLTGMSREDLLALLEA